MEHRCESKSLGTSEERAVDQSLEAVPYHVILRKAVELSQMHFFFHVMIRHNVVCFTFLNSSGCWTEGLDENP